MGKKRNDSGELLGKVLKRRQALGGIGAIVAAGPIACSSDGDGSDPGGASGSGGSATGTGGAPTGGAKPTGGSTFGGSPSNPTGGASPTGGAAPTGGAMQTGNGGTTGGTTPTGGAPANNGGGGTAAGAPGKGGSGGVSGGASGGTPAGGGSGGGGSGALVPPAWEDVPMCTASKTDGAGQGPFFIHEGEKSTDISMIRQDIRGRYNMDAEPGIEMHLHLRILSSKSSDCNGTPVKDAEIYIWHTDAQGYYSGFGNPGDQKPDMRYAGVPNQDDLDNDDRFCRGVQITGEDGVVSFRSIYPGWYNGRDLHIHFVALKKGSMSRGRMTYSGAEHLFTTQFYFDPAFSDMIHKEFEPYKRRTTIDAYEGAIKGDENGNSGLRAKATFQNNIVVAQMQILLDPKL